MTATLAERRDDALTRLDSLRRHRGAAILDGETFNDGAIIAAEQEVDALAQAEVEAVRRERDDEAARYTEIIAALSGELADKELERLAAIERAEKGARELVAGLAAAHHAAGEMRPLAGRLGKPVPAKLDGPSMASRLSQRLVAILSTMPGHRYRFGAVEWRPCWRKAEDDWAECERAELAEDIDHLRQGH
jgi:hypothetical protein